MEISRKSAIAEPVIVALRERYGLDISRRRLETYSQLRLLPVSSTCTPDELADHIAGARLTETLRQGVRPSDGFMKPAARAAWIAQGRGYGSILGMQLIGRLWWSAPPTVPEIAPSTDAGDRALASEVKAFRLFLEGGMLTVPPCVRAIIQPLFGNLAKLFEKRPIVSEHILGTDSKLVDEDASACVDSVLETVLGLYYGGRTYLPLHGKQVEILGRLTGLTAEPDGSPMTDFDGEDTDTVLADLGSGMEAKLREVLQRPHPKVFDAGATAMRGLLPLFSQVIPGIVLPDDDDDFDMAAGMLSPLGAVLAESVGPILSVPA